MDNATISDNTIEKAANNGISIRTSENRQFGSISVDGNWVGDTGAQGIYLFHLGHLDDFAVTGNTVNTETVRAGIGFRSRGDATLHNARITGNTVVNSEKDVLLSPMGAAVNLSLDQNASATFQISGNDFQSAGSNPIAARMLLEDSARLDLQFANNLVGGNLQFVDLSLAAVDFQLEDTVGSNTVTGTTTVDPSVSIVPAGTSFPFP